MSHSPMRMRRSLDHFDEEWERQAIEEEQRRSRLRREAAERAKARQRQRVQKHGNLRFFGLAAAIFATAVIVTIVMFQTLALLIGA